MKGTCTFRDKYQNLLFKTNRFFDCGYKMVVYLREYLVCGEQAINCN